MLNVISKLVRWRWAELGFVEEKRGDSEDLLKQRLQDHFDATGGVQRAYLTVVKQRTGWRVQHSVALCLVADAVDHRAVSQGTGAVFADLFRADQALDIVFLGAHDESRLRQVCSPFYVRTDA